MLRPNLQCVPLLCLVLIASERLEAQNPIQTAAGTHSIVSNTVPATISFQGYLTDDEGAPEDGSVNIEFSLYADAAGGTDIWVENHLGVPVSDGVFAVQLGADSTLVGIDFNEALWLGVRVNGGVEITPRTAFSTVPYAFGLKLPFLASADVTVGSSRGVIEIENPGSGLALNVIKSGSDAIRVEEAGDPSSMVANSGENGIEIRGAEGSGLFVGRADENGVFVYQAGNTGYYLYTAEGDGIRVDNAGGYSLNIKGSKNEVATPSGHVAIIENNSSLTGSGPDVLALKTSADDPSSAVNFITFFDGEDEAMGTIEGTGTGGVAYSSVGADFAEYLPLADQSHNFRPGDIVGVLAGRITRETTGADQLMVITDRPAVLGNAPSGSNSERHAAISFIGQVAANVVGPVEIGDYIVASGDNDGRGKAVHKSDLTLADLEKLVGRAWEGSSDDAVKRVTVAVGLDRTELLTEMVSRQHRAIDELREQVKTLLRQQQSSL